MERGGGGTRPNFGWYLLLSSPTRDPLTNQKTSFFMPVFRPSLENPHFVFRTDVGWCICSGTLHFIMSNGIVFKLLLFITWRWKEIIMFIFSHGSHYSRPKGQNLWTYLSSNQFKNHIIYSLGGGVGGEGVYTHVTYIGEFPCWVKHWFTHLFTNTFCTMI